MFAFGKAWISINRGLFPLRLIAFSSITLSPMHKLALHMATDATIGIYCHCIWDTHLSFYQLWKKNIHYIIKVIFQECVLIIWSIKTRYGTCFESQICTQTKQGLVNVVGAIFFFHRDSPRVHLKKKKWTFNLNL